MAAILIVGPDQESQSDLAASLKFRGHSVIVSDYARLSLSAQSASAIIASIEIVVFDVTSLDDEIAALLCHVCQQGRSDGCASLVLCYSRMSHGPKFQLAMERLGARFVYAG